MPVTGGLSRFGFRNLDYDTSATDPITINVWYTATLPIRNVKAYYLIVEQTNTGGTAEDIVCELTINGTIYNYSANIASGAAQYIFSYLGALGGSGSARQFLSLDADQSAPLQTRSLGIRVRQTSAVDVTSAIIEVNLVYTTKGGGT